MSEKNLAKMGSAKVNLVEYNGRRCIKKANASQVERDFYQHTANKISGVNTPQLVDLVGDTLYIEYIPKQVSLAFLHLQPSCFQQLAAIHQAAHAPQFNLKQHQWTPAATDSALSVLALPNITSDALMTMCTLSEELFSPNTLISGDSNEGNWGARKNGELVLFDWERFGKGSSAIDLAPLIRGMGAIQEYDYIVDRYLECNDCMTKDTLLKHIVLAKGWIVVEVTNLLISRNNKNTQMYLDWYKRELPNWMSRIEKVL